MYKCFVPENREQYQNFAYDDCFLLGPFRNKSEFIKFLDVQLPESVPILPSRTMNSFLELANMVAKFIKDQNFPGHPTLVFRDMGYKPPPGHVTNTMRKPDIVAALEDDWNSYNGVIPWPFIRLAGEKVSGGQNQDNQKKQVISYLHYLLLARPGLYVAQGLLSSSDKVTFLFGIGGKGIREFHVEWNDPELDQLLYAFIYRLYEPGEHFADPLYTEIKQIKLDKVTTATYTIKITTDQGSTKDCPGFYPIYASNPFATRTHVFFNLNCKVGDNDLTIFKDQFCRVGRRFEELTILNECVHKPSRVPGVVVAAYGDTIKPPLSKARCKYRLGLGESGSPFMSIPTLSNVLETLFDVLEVLRYLRLHREVLHRDISSGNVLYIENSSDRSLPPNTVSETNGLCYAKYLLDKSDNPLETSMLLVDFNLAEHLEPETSVKKKQIERTGTPIFIARAVERGGPVPPVVARVPGIPNSPDVYAKAHPDRVKDFPSPSDDGHIISQGDRFRFMVVVGDRLVDKSDQFHSRWRHELEHDAESVFWLLYWAMGAQPENSHKEKLDMESWAQLTGEHESRDELIFMLATKSPNIVHSFYEPLQPLIKDLAAILVIDSHWLPASDLRKDRYYITEAFQRLILDFIIKNSDKAFINHRVDKTFRDVHSIQNSGASSSGY